MYFDISTQFVTDIVKYKTDLLIKFCLQFCFAFTRDYIKCTMN